VLAAASYGCSDVLGKIVFASGAAPLTISAVRGVVGIGIVLGWLRAVPPAVPYTARQRWIACGLGLLFAANVWGVLKAIQLVPVPIAILTYFIYPLLTGLVGAALGIEPLGPVGLAAALVAFGGLALMIGAAPMHLAPLGLACAVGGALCRVVTLLVTRARLMEADSRLTSWYSLFVSSAALLAIAAATGTWDMPGSVLGWWSFGGVTLFSTVSILALFASATRIGAFRTALVMNLEPVVSTLLSIVVLGELVTPLQLAGAATMIGALVAFQLWR
ncbi:MAG: DMT family transporter, partial [Rhodospirillales bacterium]|nr:DMT family transporter [Rhodospirillales bacterium]